MEERDILTTIAELALGVAGFTGIVVAIGRPPGPLRPLEAYRLAMLLAVSAGAMFLALLPAVLVAGRGDVVEPWRAASLAAAGYSGLLFAFLWRPTRRYLRDTPWLFNRRLFSFIVAAHAANLLVQLANAAGLGEEAPGPRIYLAGLLWMLAHAFIQFCRLLFVPTERRGILPAGGEAGWAAVEPPPRGGPSPGARSAAPPAATG